MSFDRGKRFKCPLPEDLSYNQKYEKLKISGDTVDGCALDNGEIGTVLATGVFPIQIDFFYFEYKIIDIAEDIIIGKQFDFMPRLASIQGVTYDNVESSKLLRVNLRQTLRKV